MVNNLIFRWPKPLFFMVLGSKRSIGKNHGPSFFKVTLKRFASVPTMNPNRNGSNLPFRHCFSGSNHGVFLLVLRGTVHCNLWMSRVAVKESNSHMKYLPTFTSTKIIAKWEVDIMLTYIYPKKSRQMKVNIVKYSWSIWVGFGGRLPPSPKETGKQLLQFTFHIEATESRGTAAQLLFHWGRWGTLEVPVASVNTIYVQYTLENYG